jgi:hypothetical protein
MANDQSANARCCTNEARTRIVLCSRNIELRHVAAAIIAKLSCFQRRSAPAGSTALRLVGSFLLAGARDEEMKSPNSI